MDIEKMTDNAIVWAKAREGRADYVGWCLSFIEDAVKIGNDIEIFGGDSAKESCGLYSDALRTDEPQRGAFVFYDCLCETPEGVMDWGHCVLCVGNGLVIHAWDRIRTDGYLDIERRVAPGGHSPKYVGWVPLERVLAQKPD